MSSGPYKALPGTYDTVSHKLTKPRYDNSQRAHHPDDETEAKVLDAEYEPRDGETLADVLRRVGGIAKAAKRIMQALDALTPNAMPDYRNRLDAAKQLRDTVEGTPDKAKPRKDNGEDKDKPNPGKLKGKAGD